MGRSVNRTLATGIMAAMLCIMFVSGLGIILLLGLDVPMACHWQPIITD